MAQLITMAWCSHEVVASPWATNENQDGYDLRFRSSEYSGSSYRPKLVVTYKRQFNYVYYLKDHPAFLVYKCWSPDFSGRKSGRSPGLCRAVDGPGRSSTAATPTIGTNQLKGLSRDAGKLDEEIDPIFWTIGRISLTADLLSGTKSRVAGIKP